jgi:hypothetical protein
VFYRLLAGYLVRPLRPIVALVLLVTLVAAIRLARRVRKNRKQQTPETERPRWRTRARTGCGDFLTCFLDTLAVALPRSRGDDAPPLLLRERAEIIAYRVLVVLALIGLANSNPTLREMVDSFL